jgi:hypothetical protein
MFVLDVATESILGRNPQKIVRPGARRLNSRIPSCLTKYNGRLEHLLEKHRLQDKLILAHKLCQTQQQLKDQLDKLDQISRDCMLNAEKRCRKLRCGTIPFSPEASLWIKRCQVYRSLLHYHAGRKVNRGNLKRAARRCQVLSPFCLNPLEVTSRLRECRQQCTATEKIVVVIVRKA